MAHKVIPAGYMLVVRSSENDGDFGKTITLDGLSKEEVARYLSVMDKLEKEGLTNLYEVPDGRAKITACVKSLYSESEWRASTPKWYPSKEYFDTYRAIDVLNELGLAGMEDGQFTRCVDEVNVYLNPEPITLKDVGDEFKTDTP